MFISHFKSLSGKARHQGLLTHDQEGRFTTEMGKRLPQRSPRSAGDAARLYTRYHLPSSLDSAECHHDPQKQLTRRQQQQADDAHPSLIKLRGFGLSAGHFTLSHYAELFSETENDVLSPSKAVFPLALPAPLSAPYGDAHRASYAKTRKESQDPRDRKSSLGNAPGLFLVIGIMLFGSDICSLFPLYSTMAILVITYVILFLPYTAEYVNSA